MNQVTGADANTPSGLHTDYVRLTDSIDAISVEAPVEWSDVESGPWIIQNKNGGGFSSLLPRIWRVFMLLAQLPVYFFGGVA